MKFLWLFLFVLLSIFAFSQSDEDTTIYRYVDEEAKFPGDYADMSKFIAKNMKAPQEAIELGLEGKAAVQFVVEKDGTLTNIDLAKNTEKVYKKMMFELIKAMPKWIPATRNGKIVRSHFYLPITCIKLN